FDNFFFSSRRRHTRSKRDWSSDVCSSDLKMENFMHYLNGVGVPEGTEIKDFEHLLSLFRGKPVRVYVKQEENEYKGETKTINRRSEERRVGKERKSRWRREE